MSERERKRERGSEGVKGREWGTLRSQLALMRRLDGLRSRWMICSACMYLIPHSTWGRGGKRGVSE